MLTDRKTLPEIAIGLACLISTLTILAIAYAWAFQTGMEIFG